MGFWEECDLNRLDSSFIFVKTTPSAVREDVHLLKPAMIL